MIDLIIKFNKMGVLDFYKKILVWGKWLLFTDWKYIEHYGEENCLTPPTIEYRGQHCQRLNVTNEKEQVVL